MGNETVEQKPEWHVRVSKEDYDLNRRIISLAQFLIGDKVSQLPKEHHLLLVKQLVVMMEYQEILETRLTKFAP